MADFKVQVVLGATGGPQTKAEVKEVGDQAKESAHGVAALNEGVGKLRELLAAVGLAVGLGEIARQIVEATSQAQFAEAQLGAAIKATNDAVGISQAGLERYAETMSKNSIFTKTQFEQAEAATLVYKKLTGDTFREVIQLSADLATRLGTDPVNAARQLGKALEEPSQGLTLLRRAGLVLSDQQKEMIQTLADTGHAAKAQKIELDLLKGSLQGSAEAAHNTFGGALSDVKKIIEEAARSAGDAMTPALREMIAGFGEGAEGAKEFGRELGEDLGAGLKIAGEGMRFLAEHADAVKAVVAVLITYKLAGWIREIGASLAFVADLNPWLLALAALVGVLVYAKSKLDAANASVAQAQERFEQGKKAEDLLDSLKGRTKLLTDAEYEEAKAIQEQNVQRREQIRLELLQAQQAVESKGRTVSGAWSAMRSGGIMGLGSYLAHPPEDPFSKEGEHAQFLRDELTGLDKIIADTAAALKRLHDEKPKDGDPSELGQAQRDALKALQERLALQAVEIRSAQAVAAAELLGPAAVRQATAEATANKAVEQARIELAKVHLSLSPQMAAAIRGEAMAMAAATLAAAQNRDTYESRVATARSIVDAASKVADAEAGNSDASTRASAAFATEQKILADFPNIHSAAANAIRDSSAADTERAIAAGHAAEAITHSIQVAQQRRTAEAEVQDALSRTTSASRATAIAIAAETEAKRQGFVVGTADYEQKVKALEIAARFTEELKAQAEAVRELNAAGDAQAKARASLEDLQRQLDLENSLPPAMARVAVALAKIRSATEEVAIQEELRAKIAALGIDLDTAWGKIDAAALEVEIRGNHDVLDSLAERQILIQTLSDKQKLFNDQLATTATTLEDNIASAMVGISVDWKNVLQDLLKQWILTIIKMAEVAAAARLAQTAVGSANTGGGGGGGGAFGGIASGAAQGAGSAGVSAALGGGVGGGGLITTAVVGNPMIGGFGGSIFGGGLGAAAAVFAWIAVIVAVVSIIANFVATHQSTRAQVDLALEKGKFISENLRGAREKTGALLTVSDSIANQLNQWIDQAGLVADSIDAKIGITRSGRNRSNEFRVYVTTALGQTVKDFYRDADAAMQDAFYEALAHTTLAQNMEGMSVDPIVVAAIKGAAQRAASSMVAGITDAGKKAVADAFNQAIADAREVATLGQPQFVATERQAISHFDELRQTMVAILPAGEQLIQALRNIGAAEVQMWQSERDSITGVQQTRAQQLATAQQNARIFNDELAMRILGIKQSILELEAERDKLAGHIAGTQGVILYTRTFVDGMRAMSSAALTFGETVDTVTGQMDAATKQAYDLLSQQIDALGQLLKDLQDIKPIDPSEIHLPKGTSGGAGGPSQAQQDAQSLADFLRQAFVSRLPALQQAIAGINDKYDQEIKLAHGNGQALDELAKSRAADIALAEKQARDATRQGYAQFIDQNLVPGGALLTSLASIDTTAADLISKFNDLAAAGAISSTELANTTANIRAAAAAAKQAAANAVSADVFGQMYQLLGMDKEAAQLKYDLTLAELQVKRAELAIAVQQGLLAADILGKFDDLYNKIVQAGPAILAGGGGATSPTLSQADAIAADRAMVLGIQALTAEQARQLLDQYETGGGSGGLRDNLAKIDKDFQAIRNRLGDTAEVQVAYAKAVHDAITSFLQPIQQLSDSLLTGSTSPLNAFQKYQKSLSDMLAAESSFRAGDLSVVAGIPQLVQTLLANAQTALPTGSQAYQSLFASVQSFLQEVLAMGSAGLPPATATPPAPWAPPGTTPTAGPGAPPAPSPTAYADPIVNAIQAASAQQLAVLVQIRQSSQSTANDINVLRRGYESGGGGLLTRVS